MIRLVPLVIVVGAVVAALVVSSNAKSCDDIGACDSVVAVGLAGEVPARAEVMRFCVGGRCRNDRLREPGGGVSIPVPDREETVSAEATLLDADGREITGGRGM